MRVHIDDQNSGVTIELNRGSVQITNFTPDPEGDTLEKNLNKLVDLAGAAVAAVANGPEGPPARRRRKRTR